MASMASSDICDPWDLCILGRAKNSEMEMGTYRFFECVNQKGRFEKDLSVKGVKYGSQNSFKSDFNLILQLK